MADKPKYSLESAGHNRVRVVENSTGLIMRTVDSRQEANAWVEAVEESRSKK